MSCISCRTRVDWVRVRSHVGPWRIKGPLKAAPHSKAENQKARHIEASACSMPQTRRMPFLHAFSKWNERMNPRQHSCIKPKDIAGYGIVEVTAFVVATVGAVSLSPRDQWRTANTSWRGPWVIWLGVESLIMSNQCRIKVIQWGIWPPCEQLL